MPSTLGICKNKNLPQSVGQSDELWPESKRQLFQRRKKKFYDGVLIQRWTNEVTWLKTVTTMSLPGKLRETFFKVIAPKAPVFIFRIYSNKKTLYNTIFINPVLEELTDLHRLALLSSDLDPLKCVRMSFFCPYWKKSETEMCQNSKMSESDIVRIGKC